METFFNNILRHPTIHSREYIYYALDLMLACRNVFDITFYNLFENLIHAQK